MQCMLIVPPSEYCRYGKGDLMIFVPLLLWHPCLNPIFLVEFLQYAQDLELQKVKYL